MALHFCVAICLGDSWSLLGQLLVVILGHFLVSLAEGLALPLEQHLADARGQSPPGRFGRFQPRAQSPVSTPGPILSRGVGRIGALAAAGLLAVLLPL